MVRSAMRAALRVQGVLRKRLAKHAGTGNWSQLFAGHAPPPETIYFVAVLHPESGPKWGFGLRSPGSAAP